MTKDESKQARAVMQAWEEGKTIQLRSLRSSPSEWIELILCPLWNWEACEYRVKPEPRDFWFIKNIGDDERRFGWSRCDVRQEGVDYLEQIHVREVL